MSPCSTAVFALDCHVHIGRQPWPCVYFTIRAILFCRRLKPLDSYKRTSPRGPEAKHLRPCRTPINGVVRSRETVFHVVCFSKCMYALPDRSLSRTPMRLLLVDAPNRAIPMNGMFHAKLQPLRAFISSYPIDGILRAYEKCGRPINRILNDTTSAFTHQPRLCHTDCSILTFGRPSFADHPRAFFSSGDYSTVLLGMTSTRFDLRETFITTFTFSVLVFFLLGPYSPFQI